MAPLSVPALTIRLAVLAAGAFLVLTPSSCLAFWSPLLPRTVPTTNRRLLAKAIKKKKPGPAAAAGLKGFGAPSIPKSGSTVETDRSAAARAFYDYLEKGGAGDNWKRCALGYFNLANGMSLRGVVALRDMKKGDVVLRIPYELAVNLGQEGGDPTLPAVVLLNDYCHVMLGGAEDANRKAYYDMLPPFQGDDCRGSTDFFSEEALGALQSPTIVDETKKRRDQCNKRFEQEIATDHDFPSWMDGSPVTEEHLQWAVWLITSRVLTVQGDATEGNSYRLLIPFLDMCNHDRTSPHILSGRAVPGGELKVVAGAAVKAGDPINICYGGGVAGNDRFLQDYGFLDSHGAAYDMVAAQWLGQRRILEGAGAGRIMAEADREVALKTLRSTTMHEDQILLDSAMDSGMRSALEFRLGVKQALSKQIIMQ